MELETIRSMIYEVRGVRVMLDFDLARLYQVENRTLKQAVRRNILFSAMRHPHISHFCMLRQ